MPGPEAQFEVSVVEDGSTTLRNVASRGLLQADTFGPSDDVASVHCIRAGFADGERVLWVDAKEYLPVVARERPPQQQSSAPSPPCGGSSPHRLPRLLRRQQCPNPFQTESLTTRPPEIRRNAATGDVVVIAPERLARLKVDPFKYSPTTELLDQWPEMDESGGLAWKEQHADTFAALVRIAKRATGARRTVSITALQDALVLAGPRRSRQLPNAAPHAGWYTSAREPSAAASLEPSLPPGLPIPPKSTAPTWRASSPTSSAKQSASRSSWNARATAPSAPAAVMTCPRPARWSTRTSSCSVVRDVGLASGAARAMPTPASVDRSLEALNDLDLQGESDGHALARGSARLGGPHGGICWCRRVTPTLVYVARSQHRAALSDTAAGCANAHNACWRSLPGVGGRRHARALPRVAATQCFVRLLHELS